MSWMNRHEVDSMLNTFDEDSFAIIGARTLYRLKEWTDDNSDGWPYWQKPQKAADRLMSLLQEAERSGRRDGAYTDVGRAELVAAFRPIKAFLTRQGVEHSEVFYTTI